MSQTDLGLLDAPTAKYKSRTPSQESEKVALQST